MYFNFTIAGIVSPTLRAEVVNECTGIEAVIFLVPAMLAFPSSWRAKIAGMALGLSVMAVLNFLRVLSLCYIGTFWVERIAIPHHR